MFLQINILTNLFFEWILREATEADSYLRNFALFAKKDFVVSFLLGIFWT